MPQRSDLLPRIYSVTFCPAIKITAWIVLAFSLTSWVDHWVYSDLPITMDAPSWYDSNDLK